MSTLEVLPALVAIFCFFAGVLFMRAQNGRGPGEGTLGLMIDIPLLFVAFAAICVQLGVFYARLIGSVQ